MYNDELVIKIYSKELLKALKSIEERRQLIELRRTRKDKLKKIKEYYDKK